MVGHFTLISFFYNFSVKAGACATPNALDEVVPNSFEGEESPPKARKRRVGAVSKTSKVFDISSDNSKPKKDQNKIQRTCSFQKNQSLLCYSCGLVLKVTYCICSTNVLFFLI